MKLPPISWLPRIVAGVAMVYLSMSSALIVADFILRSAKGSSESSESISSFVLCNRYTWSFPSLPNVQQYVSHVLR